MKCPHCAAESPDGAAECSKCGLLFAKLKAQREREKLEAAEFLAQAGKPLPPPPDPWKGRLIASGVVMLWFVLLFAYFVMDLNRRAEKQLPPGTVVPARP